MTAGVQMSVVVPLAACVGVAVASYAAIIRYRKKEWREGGKIKKLFIYPIKSLPPIEVMSAELTLQGVRHKGLRDREFLLLDADKNNEFITARTEPSLLLIDLSYNVEKNCLQLRSRDPQNNMELLEVPLGVDEAVDTSTILSVNTWERNGAYDAYRCNENIRTWFCKYLSKNVLVVRYIRPSKPRTDNGPERFQDQANLNILSEGSVDNLVALIKDPSANVSHRNFRPNILLETKHPHEEDFWSRVKIGAAETEFLRRCTRCVLTTINPDSGVRTEKEPMATLRKFRIDRSAGGKSKYKSQPLFSCHHSIRSPGVIHVGQTILVEQAARELI